ARALNLIPLTVWFHADEMLAKEYVKLGAGTKADVPDHAVRQHALDWRHEERKRIAGDPTREAFVVTRGGRFGVWVNPVKGDIPDWQEDEYGGDAGVCLRLGMQTHLPQPGSCCHRLGSYEVSAPSSWAVEGLLLRALRGVAHRP